MNINKLIITLLVILFMASAASADSYYGGIPLTTVEEGTVSGGVYFDSYYGIAGQTSGSPNTIDKTFTLPSYTNISSAMLLTTVYDGNMQNNYQGMANITFNGVVLGNETLNVPFVNIVNGGNGSVWVNDHVNRVTSDYIMWYNVTNLIQPGSNTASVHTQQIDSTFDGRIKLITLIVAYNDGSNKEIHYWVNRGHDTVTYQSNYIGSTSFAAALPAGVTLKDARLTAVHMASTDGIYTFNSNNIANGTPQGTVAGSNAWNVTGIFNPSGTNTMTYNRSSSFYKIAIGILTAEYQEQTPGALSISATPTTVTAGIPTDVTFTVTSNGIAVGDASVSLSGSATGSGMTDANGTAVISMNATGAGTITATASKTGYTSGTASLTANAAETPSLSISANPTTIFVSTPTDVTFTVTSNGSTVNGALVTLSGSATGSGTTDANGSVKINVNATGAGTITATASKTGYTSGTTTLTASAKHTGVSSLVSLGADIIPAISLVVTPNAIDFGKLSPGQTSSAQTLTLNNTGGYGISVTADVNDTASNLFMNGLLLDSNAWGAYSTSIDSKTSKQAGASLKVPDDYAGVGAKEGTLVFWAEAH
jgi:hypothetical protein